MPDNAPNHSLPSSAATEEDRLLQILVTDVQRERLQRQRLLDEVERLKRALGNARAALTLAEVDLAKLRHSVGSDALTGLPNRQGFDKPSRRVLASHGAGRQELALLFVDLDGFKAVNDRLGHKVGDELLRIVGARLAAAVREGDLVCRHGGDEFLCLLPQIALPEHAAAIAAALVEAIAAPCQIGRHRMQVRASIGVALYPRDGRSVGALVKQADAAMYLAKAHGCGVALAHAGHANGNGGLPLPPAHAPRALPGTPPSATKSQPEIAPAHATTPTR